VINWMLMDQMLMDWMLEDFMMESARAHVMALGMATVMVFATSWQSRILRWIET